MFHKLKSITLHKMISNRHTKYLAVFLQFSQLVEARGCSHVSTVTKRPVTKRPVTERPGYKTSRIQNDPDTKRPGYKTTRIQNVQDTKRGGMLFTRLQQTLTNKLANSALPLWIVEKVSRDPGTLIQRSVTKNWRKSAIMTTIAYTSVIFYSIPMQAWRPFWGCGDMVWSASGEPWEDSGPLLEAAWPNWEDLYTVQVFLIFFLHDLTIDSICVLLACEIWKRVWNLGSSERQNTESKLSCFVH